MQQENGQPALAMRRGLLEQTEDGHQVCRAHGKLHSSLELLRMSLRIVGFVLAVTLLLAYRIVPAFGRRRTLSPPLIPTEQWSLFKLFLASALTLFTELALIRWVATE